MNAVIFGLRVAAYTAATYIGLRIGIRAGQLAVDAIEDSIGSDRQENLEDQGQADEGTGESPVQNET